MSCIPVHFNDTSKSNQHSPENKFCIILRVLQTYQAVPSVFCQCYPFIKLLQNLFSKNNNILLQIPPIFGFETIEQFLKKRHTNGWSDSLCNRQIFPSRLIIVVVKIHQKYNTYYAKYESLVLLSLCVILNNIFLQLIYYIGHSLQLCNTLCYFGM